MEVDNRPHVLMLFHEYEGSFVWVRPNYDAALQTFRVWFAIMLVEFSEKYADRAEEYLGDFPNPATMSYEEIAYWIFDNDTDWDIFLLPISMSSDPLDDFYKHRVKDFPSTEQERIKQNAARAAKWALGQG